MRWLSLPQQRPRRRWLNGIRLQLDQLFRKRGQPILVAFGETVHDVEVATFDIAEVPHALQKRRGGVRHGEFLGARRQKPDERPLVRNLGQRGGNRPRGRAAEKRNELPPFHSITSSASC